MFSSDAAQGAKDEVHDEETSKDRPREEKLLTTEPLAETEVGRRKDLGDIPSHQLSNQPGHDSITDNPVTFSNAKSGHSPTDAPDKTTSLHTKSDLSTGSDSSHPHRRMNSAAEKYTSTSEFYHATIGKRMDWKEAVETVTKNEQTNSRRIKNIKYTKRWNALNRNKSKRSATDIPSVKALAVALWQEEKSNQYLFRLYRNLPTPGVSYLSKRTRGELLRRFANPPNRRWVDARRYLALVEDMIRSNLSLSRSLWTSAINLAGRAAGRLLKKDLIRALGLWQQMEYVAGIQSDEVVFDILLDAAIKSGQYTVADRLLVEAKKRDLDFDRFGKVTTIYFSGMRQDIEGIRRNYADLVNSGRFMDTVVLNCLVVAFIRADDVKSAEQLYHSMMQAQTTAQKHLMGADGTGHPHLPTLSSEFTIYRRRSRKLGRLLEISAPLKDLLPELHKALQEALPMTPDTRTFHILLKYHAHESGNLHGFMSVLADMENTFAVPPRGMIYLLLFEGFSQHGRRRKMWSAERLHEAWRAYLRVLYESKHRLDERFLPQTRKIVWENPLASTAAALALKPRRAKDEASGLYTPLPSVNSKAEAESEEAQVQQSESQMEEDPSEKEDEEYDMADDIDVDELFGSPARNQQEPQQDELEEMERRIENGAFLGRRMIVMILRAFGACCGPQEVMEVWIKMERIWQPEKRKVLDVIVVREELEKQLSRFRH